MENPLWDDKPFSKGQAWIDLLLLANHKNKDVLLGNNIVNIQRGSFITSELKLIERWGWSKTKVRAFLKMLEDGQMIVKKSDRKKTTITIVKYGEFQDSQTIKEPQKDHEETAKEPLIIHNQERKNDKNEKNIEDIVPSTSAKEPTEYPYKEVIEYLNQKGGTAYRASSKDTRKHIKARFDEGFTLENFKAVIDKKVEEWAKEPEPGDRDMRGYIRPSTLFGTKFEGYLNQKGTGKKKRAENKFNNFEQREYDFENLERQMLMSQGG